MDPLFEKKLVKGLLARDQATFERVVEYYQKDIFNLSIRYLGNEQDSLDVTQEVFIKILNKIDTFQGKSKLSTWIYRITVNCCKDFIKAQNKVKNVSLDKPLNSSDDKNYGDIEDERDKPEEILQKKMQNQQLISAIDLLEEEQREVIILRYINDLSYNEISKILNLPEGTVKSRLNRGRRKLQKILKEDGTYFS